MIFNPISIIVAVIIPFIIGFIYYHPKVMGTAWMRASNLTIAELEKSNMMVIFGSCAVFNFLLAVQMHPITIHQWGFFSTMQNHQAEMEQAGTAANQLFEQFKPFMNEFRTYKHGAFHGFLTSIFLVLPIIGVNALFERKTWKYIGIHWLYWAIVLMATGAFICGWH